MNPPITASCCLTQNKLHLYLFILFFSPQNRELQIMRKLDHCNIVRLRYFFYSSGDKVSYFTIVGCLSVPCLKQSMHQAHLNTFSIASVCLSIKSPSSPFLSRTGTEPESHFLPLDISVVRGHE